MLERSGFRRRVGLFLRCASAIFVCASALSLAACQEGKQKDPRSLTAMVSVEGSDTMAQVIRTWADQFMKINSSVPVSITSEDSGAGIAALINRTTDLAAASRDLTAKEEQLARSKGVRLKRVTVARDAIAVIVNGKNPLSHLTMQQLKKIYTGEIKNWSSVGGGNEAIEALSREPGSGTGKYFKDHVLGESAYGKSLKIVNSHESIIEEVGKNRQAIGYTSIGLATANSGKVKILELKLVKGAEAVGASKASTTGYYPLSRPLFIFMDAEPKESVKQFVDFCLSAAGQKTVEAAGYVSIGDGKAD
ncbi:MAG TPA: PstS family phosphate ABC transporter substrate-binding protein [Candidatus Obscuribacterales bacterium]